MIGIVADAVAGFCAARIDFIEDDAEQVVIALAQEREATAAGTPPSHSAGPQTASASTMRAQGGWPGRSRATELFAFGLAAAATCRAWCAADMARLSEALMKVEPARWTTTEGEELPSGVGASGSAAEPGGAGGGSGACSGAGVFVSADIGVIGRARVRVGRAWSRGGGRVRLARGRSLARDKHSTRPHIRPPRGARRLH